MSCVTTMSPVVELTPLGKWMAKPDGFNEANVWGMTWARRPLSHRDETFLDETPLKPVGKQGFVGGGFVNGSV